MPRKARVPNDMLEAAEPFDGCCNTPDVLKAALQWLVDELSKSEGMSPMLNGTYQDGWNGAWRHILRFLAPGSDADILMEILPAPIHLTVLDEVMAHHRRRHPNCPICGTDVPSPPPLPR